MDSQNFENIIRATPPHFHYWDGKRQPGGMEGEGLVALEREIRRLGKPDQLRLIETGAGLSTLWMLHLGAQLTTFVYEERIVAEIQSFLAEHAPSYLDRWTYFIGNSEIELPRHAIGLEPYADFCLIDGGHGLTTVVLDWVYFHYLLKKGGTMMIDDLKIGSCRLVHDMSLADGSYSPISGNGKMAFLRKETDRRHAGDWLTHRSLLDAINASLDALPDG